MTIETLKQYLYSKSITPGGQLVEDIRDNNLKSLFYVIYAIEQYPGNINIEKRIRSLAQRKGSFKNDIRRNYENILVELQALYILAGKMRYKFIDFDIPSSKEYARKNSNCDMLVERNNTQYFVEVKQSSTELMSKVPNANLDLIHINNPLIPEVLERYIYNLIIDAETHGCDFLVMQIPKWGLPNLEIATVSAFLKKVSACIMYKEGKWFWPIKNTHITKLIFPKGLEYIEINVV